MAKLQQLHEDIYSSFQEFIYQKLWQQYKNEDITFSVRIRSNDKTVNNIFIGTNNYFAFTYWDINMSIPNPRDFADFFFNINPKDNTLNFFFQIGCPKDDSSIAGIKICEYFLKNKESLNVKSSKDESKQLVLKVTSPKKSYFDFDELWLDFALFQKKIVLIMDNAINQVKTIFPNVIANKIELEVFKSNINKLNQRLKDQNMLSNKKIETTVNNSENIISLNQILYGPPGTGKTYTTVELAYKIIHNDTPNSYEEARNWYKTALANTEDRQVDFITFHQNYSYEDFVMGIKPDLNEGDGLSFNRHEGIFFKLCQRALENLKQSAEDGSIVEPTFNEVFDDFIRPLAEDNLPITIQMKSNNHSFKLININERNLGFEKQGGGTNHTLTLKTIKDLYEGNREYNIQGLGVYYYPLIERLKSLARTKSKQVNAVPLKNYVIIIDEINRANISRVFGELITLIEEDKRWGNKFETEVRLPDGVTKFTVPRNLYIIGTMNTADKSIALLDIALRRRFNFVPLYPDVDQVAEKYKAFFVELNRLIRDKKGIDFCIGHSYFMESSGKPFDFVNTMNSKVIPLLNEYFYNPKSNKEVVSLIENTLKATLPTFKVQEGMFQLTIQANDNV